MINKLAAALTSLFVGVAVLLGAPTANSLPTHPLASPRHHKTDCDHIKTGPYRALCRAVSKQHAYGYTDNEGNPQNWVPSGRTLVHEITHQGYTQAEMTDALIGADETYRGYVTEVTFNVDAIARECGHHRGAGEVLEVKGTDGHRYTWKHTVCD